ncbi:MAG: UTRA domain-containing protein [Actinomycetaceae bacterium]|nr:UTRA domain-containing protein [Actinomycetaceae bacterium]
MEDLTAVATAKYTEIYAVLRQRIESGIYGFQDFLPSENSLSQDFGVTRNTLRKALTQLAHRGYIQSMQGRGNQVIYRQRDSSRFFLSEIESFAEATARLGLTTRTVLLSSEQVTISREVAQASGLPEGAHAWSLVRLRYLDERPVIIDRSLFLVDIVPYIPEEAATTSVYDYLENVVGVSTYSSLRMVTIDAADDLDRQYLDLDGLDCVAVVESIGFEASGLPFEYTFAHHVPATFGFLVVARRPPA